MNPTIKGCDNCGAPVDADYAITALGVCLCDACLVGDDPDPFATVLRERRGIRLDDIDDICNAADGVIVAQQVQRTRNAIDRSRTLFNRGERLAAMEAAQSAWNEANGLFNALDFLPELLRDRKRQAGTQAPRRPKVDKWIATQLTRNPGAKSPALWGAAPEWITDQIGFRAFAARVTKQRKLTPQ